MARPTLGREPGAYDVDMGEDASFNEELQVSKCHCETGRERHRIPRSIQIPFENSYTVHVPDPVDHSEDESDDESIDDSPASDQGDEDVESNGPADEETDNTPDDHYLVAVDNFNVGILQLPPATTPLPMVLNEAFIQDDAADAQNNDLEWEVDDMDTDMASEPSTAPSEPVAQEPEDTFDEEGPPQIATWRLNLTALSQVYNFYIVAYGDKIYVSRPRSCITHVLPVEPDLILRPRASIMSLAVGGYLDESFPHQVNHLIVGDLGLEEILLLAYDDGDVIGYYTGQIEDELLRRENESPNSGKTPHPFFHENVGKSAWGLAVHKQSRIIAVSSNTHNVCVFVFALTGQPYRHTAEVDPVEFFRNIRKDEKGNIVTPDRERGSPVDETEQASKGASLEHAVRRRDANWRIILETGRAGTNIPNITFADDADGEAEKVASVDINGAVWLMDIWSFNQCPHIKIDRLHYNRNGLARRGHFQQTHRPRGWGILVLPESSFLPTESYRDSLGVPRHETTYIDNEKTGRWIDISQGVKYIKNNSGEHPWVRSGSAHRFAINPHEPRRIQLETPWHDSSPGNWKSTPWSFQDTMPFKNLATYHSQRSALARQQYTRTLGPPRPKPIFENGSSILRTYEMDIELRSFEEDGVGIMFEKSIYQSRPDLAVLPSVRVSHERLATLIHVPELSLVVAASMCGRVALITLTRPKYGNFSFKRGFKIEAILPTKREEDGQLRPVCPLLGVAVGPVPFSGNLELAEEPVSRRRYRLMLHYYDLRILSYELSRKSAADGLSIL
ncbi:hypothetical protein F4779DRAFT_393224 [Xylariaceae sp. FL0662B]|nr:hypothetical protein F4779DRAFT_393224 [Xylariaceae sp. FL0662B]